MVDPISSFGVEQLSGFMSGFGNIIIVLIIGVVFLVLGLFVMKRLQYNIFVHIYEVANNRKIVSADKARQFKDKDNVIRWQLQKSKHIVLPPSDDCIEVTNKGKRFVAFMRRNGTEYTAITSEIKLDPTSANINRQEMKPDERAEYARQIQKAEEEKGKGLLNTIKEWAVPVAVIILIALTFVFWGKITEPTLKVAEINAQASGEFNRALDRMSEICGQTQIIRQQSLNISLTNKRQE